MHIRRARELDKDAFIKQYVTNFSETTDKTARELFEEKVSNPMSGFILIAEENDKLLGIVAVDIFDLTAHIVGLAVQKEYRKQGIGTKLVGTALEEIPYTNRNVCHVVISGMEATQKIATKLGFIKNDMFFEKYL